MRLIDADALIAYINDNIDLSKEMREEAKARNNEVEKSYNNGEIVEARRIKRYVNMFAPTIDAVPVVRCRECKHHRNGSCPMRSLHVATRGYCIQDNTVDDGFCHMGAKMDAKEE